MKVSKSVSTVSLAAGGPQVSRIVYGAWRLANDSASASATGAAEKIRACLDLGITTFDHADIYGDYRCESLFGDGFLQSGVARGAVQLITKCGINLVSGHRPCHRIKHYDTSREHIVASVENSLRALRTDRVDLLLLHRPDPLMCADEIADAFRDLHREGKALHFGVSNFTPFQVELLASRLVGLPFSLVTNQVEASVLHQAPFQDGTLDQCQRLRIAPMAWSPLGGGRLFGDTAQARRVREALATIGAQQGDASPEQVALAWLLRHPSRIVPIVGTGNVHRLRSAAEAESIVLTREQWFTVWAASAGADVS